MTIATVYSLKSSSINKTYRKGEWSYEIEELQEVLEGLKTLVPLLTYRGQREDIFPSGFISTSISEEVAQNFGSVIYKFWGYGANLIPSSVYKAELEILYPPVEWVDVNGVYVQQGMEEEYHQWVLEGSKDYSLGYIPSNVLLKEEYEGCSKVQVTLPHWGWSKAEPLPLNFKEGIEVTRDIPEAGFYKAEQLPFESYKALKGGNILRVTRTIQEWGWEVAVTIPK